MKDDESQEKRPSRFAVDYAYADQTLGSALKAALETLEDGLNFSALRIPKEKSIPLRVYTSNRIFVKPERTSAGLSAFKHKPSTIVVGNDFFKHDIVANTKGQGYQLIRLGANANDAMLCCLSHELAHIDESERMAGAGVDFFTSNERFASAIRPEFSEQVNALFFKAAEAFREGFSREGKSGFKPMPLAVAQAQDIATELCADLMGIERLRRMKVNTTGMEKALIALRQADEAKSIAEYQFDGALEPLLAKRMDFEETIRATAEASIQKLKIGMDVPADIRELACQVDFPIGISRIEAADAKPGIFKRIGFGKK